MRRLIAVCLTVILFSAGSAMAAYSGGTGEPNSPYRIGTVADWQELMAATGDWNKYFLLTADIDLAGVNLTPVGNDQKNFTGVFAGNSHIIRNAVMNLPSTSYVGLFGYVYYPGQIKNLGVEDADITGLDAVGCLVGLNVFGSLTSCHATGSVDGYSEVGGLCGGNGDLNQNQPGGIISNCYASSSVSGYFEVGGIVGDNYGGMTTCCATGSVAGIDYVGGLVGYNWHASVTSCYATGSVRGQGDIGGLLGYNWSGTVISSYATGSVIGADYVGGLAGKNSDSTMTSCYATGSVSGGDYVGGLVGLAELGSVDSCYAAGSVNGQNWSGGLVGFNWSGNVISSYAIGFVTGNGYFIGGLVGYNVGSVTSSFWDIETSSLNNSAGGEGESTIEMKMRSTFASAGWDFATVWAICDGTNYPRLRWQIPADDWACPDGIDFKDYAVLAKAWMSGPGSASWNPACDISDTKDNIIDWSDLTIFAEDWLAAE